MRRLFANRLVIANGAAVILMATASLFFRTERTTGDIAPVRFLVVIPAYLVAMYWPFSAHFFHLTMFAPLQWLEVLAVVVPTLFG